MANDPGAPGARERAHGQDLQRRIEALQTALRKRRLDGMIVYTRPNATYLSGFISSLSYLLVTPREAVLLIDGRYVEAARAAVSHCEVRLFTDLRKSLGAWQKQHQPRRLGFEGAAPWNTITQWREMLPGVDWEESGELLRKLRMVKSTAEIDWITRAARLNDDLYDKMLRAVRAGATELTLRNTLRAAIDAMPGAAASFEAIVAAGAMSSRPHYEPADRPLEPGGLLLIDMGVSLGGYCSDMTRVVGLGRRPKPRLMKVYEAVLEAQEAALANVGPGVHCAELDRIARDKIKARRLGSYFTHGLGHGVGLEIHEPPTLNARSQDELRAGMVITIEPGVYLPGLGGVRIEDLVLVTRTGHQVLSRTPKAFRTVPLAAAAGSGSPAGSGAAAGSGAQ